MYIYMYMCMSRLPIYTYFIYILTNVNLVNVGNPA